MWTRKELKTRAKQALKLNYWKAVLIGFILMLVGGGIGGIYGSFSGASSSFSISGFNNETTDGSGEVVKINSLDDLKEFLNSSLDEFKESFNNPEFKKFFTIFLISMAVIICVVSILAILFSIFVTNPVIVGAQHFFSRSLNEEGDLNHLARGFKGNYKNVVKIMFLVGLKTFLWSLLFIIPGIIASYRYLMIPYILGDNPDISTKDAFELSKRMMDGNKWKAFVLGLSFILWNILSVFTCGLLSIFYVMPYQYYTFAALYRRLKGEETPFIEETVVNA